MQLLLFMKATGSKVTWHDPTVEQTECRFLSAGDWRVWVRFLMSFLINGVGFHILVHALPIQVAGQGSLTGVVFRAVGMLYLVDLDDSPGYTLTFTDHDDEIEAEKAAKNNSNSDNNEATKGEVGGTDSEEDMAEKQQPYADAALASNIEQVLQEAHAKIDALRAGAGAGSTGKVFNLSGGMALAAAGGVAAASAVNKQTNGGKKEQTEDTAAGEGGTGADL